MKKSNKLFIVTIGDGGAYGDPCTMKEFEKTFRILDLKDAEVLNQCKNSKPGDVIEWRMGWIFITNR